MIKVLYFASFRERLGVEDEQIDTPADVRDLLQQLSSRDGVWAQVLGGDAKVLVAVNQEMAQPGTSLADGDEVGIFPPVTGG